MNKETFAVQLFEAGAIKFGEFVLKTGILSPIYVDLRILISYPDLVEQIGDGIGQLVNQLPNNKLICGVPYTAIPFASWVSVRQRIPMLMRRKEAKSYGTKQLIEGHYKKGQKTLIIEDILSSGTSILETVIALKTVELSITDAIVILDREQGGLKNLADLGINIHSLISLSEVLNILSEKKLISEDVKRKSLDWLAQNPVKIAPELVQQFNSMPDVEIDDEIPVKKAKLTLSKQSLTELSKTAPHPIQKRVFELIHRKQSNLCVSIDETKCDRILDLIQTIGEHVVIVKLHADIIEDFSDEFIRKARELAEKYEFLFFEDRKFADIGNTVRLQFSKGLHKIREWADIVNCHSLPGPGVLKGIQSGLENRNVGCLIVAELSCAENLINYEYTKKSVAMAESNPELVVGFISQSRLSNNPHLIHMSPGVNLDAKGDQLGQQYISPAEAILNRGADVIIVGRGITNADDPLKAALDYKINAFECLKQRLSEL